MAAMREHERCDACGFDGATYDDAALLASLRSLASQWDALLESAGPELRVRPAPEVWSAIEYAAHTRDIAALHLFGVKQALTGTEPVFPPIDDGMVDAAAVGYGDADPREVVSEIGEQAQALAQVADDARPAAWTQGITVGEHRSDVRRMLEHVLHDALHHLEDVERGLAQLRA
jgi:S-DNA-T family DNA segregation ATPase FtsK/SpoIIIE